MSSVKVFKFSQKVMICSKSSNSRTHAPGYGGVFQGSHPGVKYPRRNMHTALHSP
jgi:hypothetical protein